MDRMTLFFGPNVDRMACGDMLYAVCMADQLKCVLAHMVNVPHIV